METAWSAMKHSLFPLDLEKLLDVQLKEACV